MLIVHACLITLELLEMVKHICPKKMMRIPNELERVLGPIPLNHTENTGDHR